MRRKREILFNFRLAEKIQRRTNFFLTRERKKQRKETNIYFSSERHLAKTVMSRN